MTDNNLFSNVPATNGLARGYGPRPHKRKRKGLRFAVVVLLLALAGVAYFNSEAWAEEVRLEGEAAQRMIVRGHQQAYWREQKGLFTYHRYAIHDARGQVGYNSEVSRVYECVHYMDVRQSPAPLVVVCRGQKDSE